MTREWHEGFTTNEQLSLDDLADIQDQFEEKYWDGPSTRFDKFKHVSYHLVKAVGKVFTYIERNDHNVDVSKEMEIVRTQVVADLLYYALSLAKLTGVDLQEAYLNRLNNNAARVSEWVRKRDNPPSGE